MSGMVERVAKAMAENEGDHTVTDHWRHRALAAIGAMREPTDAMLEVALFDEGAPDDVWEAMIEAALK